MEDNLILTDKTYCDAIPCDCGTPVPTSCECGDSVNYKCTDENIHEPFVKLAAILQESVMYSWRLHLKAKKYSVHVILEEYYNDAFDIIDGLIEHYQGICKCDIIDDCVITGMNKSEDPFTYFAELKEYLLGFMNNPDNFNERTNEIKSDIDDLLRLIDSTLYKLGNLSESKIKSFGAFVYENF